MPKKESDCKQSRVADNTPTTLGSTPPQEDLDLDFLTLLYLLTGLTGTTLDFLVQQVKRTSFSLETQGSRAVPVVNSNFKYYRLLSVNPIRRVSCMCVFNPDSRLDRSGKKEFERLKDDLIWSICISFLNLL